MPKQILVIKSSPRGAGNSATLAEQAAAGARQAGANVETFFLPGMDIRPCDGCDFCRQGGDCLVLDDMQKIYPRLLAADAIVLASPIYWFTYSAQLKIFIDRWYAAWNAQNSLFEQKSFGVILTYGDTDLDTSGGINAVHTLETMFRFLGVKHVEWVHGSLSEIGDAQKNPELMQKAYEMGRRLALL